MTEPCARIEGVLHPTEGAGAAAAGGAAETSVVTSLATLLTRHLLRDGELVILILKPSIWFIPLSALKFIAIVLVAMLALRLFGDHIPHPVVYFEAGVFLIAGRLMFAILQWTGRLYVLTDLRIARISGVFNVNIFDCPLRKVARTRLISPQREKLLGVGTIEIIPSDESLPVASWRTIARPHRVHEVITATVNRAKQGGSAGN